MGLASWSNIRSVPTTLGSAIRRWKAGLVRHTLVPAADAPSAHDGITRFARVRTGNGWVRLLAFPIHVTVVITIPLLLPWGYWEYQVEMSTQMHGSGITRSGQALREKERVRRQLCHNLVMWACHRIPSASAVNRVAAPVLSAHKAALRTNGGAGYERPTRNTQGQDQGREGRRVCSIQGHWGRAPSRDHVFSLLLITLFVFSLQNHQPSPFPFPCSSLSSRTCKKALGMLESCPTFWILQARYSQELRLSTLKRSKPELSPGGVHDGDCSWRGTEQWKSQRRPYTPLNLVSSSDPGHLENWILQGLRQHYNWLDQRSRLPAFNLLLRFVQMSMLL